MTRESIHDYLTRLQEVILAEREYAKQLDLEAMISIQEEKEALIQVLSRVEVLHPEHRQLAKDIQAENRRNAYLFKSTLNWIQETMEFFGRKTTTSTYGRTGSSYAPQVNGRLLSGRI
jgi:flagellar biosynthesis/type III secretory pathway chaperone